MPAIENQFFNCHVGQSFNMFDHKLLNLVAKIIWKKYDVLFYV